MGRVKLKIKKLENPNGRQATFAKRKNGILKKANELSILCDIDVVLLMFSPTDKPWLCVGRRSRFEQVINKFSKISPQEIMKRKFESLKVLKKTFQKLDHNVNIREFIASNNPTVEGLSNQARMLQARISDLQGRLNNWIDPEKLKNVEHLGKLEITMKQSLEQLHAHKEHLRQQQQAMQIENANFVKDWSTFSMQDGIRIPLEQQLQSLQWILNSNTANVVTEEQNAIPQREVECSASSSFGSYPGYFGTGKSPEVTISGQETSFLDELNNGQLKQQTNSQQQFTNNNDNNNIAVYNPNLQNDLNQHQTMLLPPPPPQVYIPVNQREYQMNGFFDAPQPGSSAFNNNINQTRFGSSSNSLPCSLSMFDEYLFSQMHHLN